MRVSSVVLIVSALILAAGPGSSAELRGSVTDAAGAPVQGASVYLDGTPKGVSTDASGKFLILNVQPGDYLLVATMVGATTVKRPIRIDAGATVLELSFTLDRIPLDLGEVVVTANKVREDLQNVPGAVSAITSEKIEDLSIRDRTEISSVSPNCFIGDTGCHMSDLINIRGIVPSTPMEATSLFYYDGVPIYGYGMNPMYLNDIERIEVIRGPQGTLYGRNALAGVVSIVSQKPANTTRASFELDYGSYGEFKQSFGTSFPVIRNGLYARASAYNASRDGYYTNTYLNKNAGWSKGRGGTLNLRYFPSDRFRAEFFANVEHIRESIWPFAIDPSAALADPYRFQADMDSKIDKRNTIGSLKLGYIDPRFEVVSTTAYQDISDLDWQYDADFTSLDVIGFLSRTPYRTFSQEVRCQSVSRSSRLKWMAGAFYANDSEDSDFGAILGEVWAQANHVPIWPLYQNTIGTKGTKGLAGFGQVTYTLFGKLDLTSGVRAERQTIDIDSATQFLYNGEPLPPSAPPPLRAVTLRNQTKEFDFVTPRFAASYRLGGSSMVYGSASRGVHGGGFNSRETPVPWYSPEFMWNYEVGYKTSLIDNTLRVDANAFWVDWRDQQVLTVGDLSSPLQTITNAGKAVNKGLELEVAALPIRGLTVGATFGFLEAKFDKFVFTEVKDGVLVAYDYSGNDLQFTPRYSSSVNAKYEFPAQIAGHRFNGVLACNYTYVDPYYMSHMNLFRSNARQLVGGRIGFSTRSVDVFLWTKNLLDNRYVTTVYEYRGGEQAFLGSPRRVGLTVGYRY